MKTYIDIFNERVIELDKNWKLRAWNNHACQIINNYKNLSDLLYFTKSIYTQEYRCFTSFKIPKHIEKIIIDNIKEIRNFLGVNYED